MNGAVDGCHLNKKLENKSNKMIKTKPGGVGGGQLCNAYSCTLQHTATHCNILQHTATGGVGGGQLCNAYSCFHCG